MELVVAADPALISDKPNMHATLESASVARFLMSTMMWNSSLTQVVAADAALISDQLNIHSSLSESLLQYAFNFDSVFEQPGTTSDLDFQL